MQKLVLVVRLYISLPKAIIVSSFAKLHPDTFDIQTKMYEDGGGNQNQEVF